MSKPDAVVVGSGPNGLAAAIVLAQAGRTVVVREAASVAGGGLRSDALTKPGFIHDTCAALLPLAAASPFLRTLPLERYGLKWVEPPIALAHPFDDGSVALLQRSVEDTAKTLGRDGSRYVSLVQPIVDGFDTLLDEVLAPLHIPRHPLLLARFGWRAMRSARRLTDAMFRDKQAAALCGATAAHAIVQLDRIPSAAFAIILLGAAHHVGWPLIAGGSQRLAEALAAHLKLLGGEIITDAPVNSLDELVDISTVLLDLTPPQFIAIAGHRLPGRYLRALKRYRFGPAAFKMDWALSGPVPWLARECHRAGALHLGGSVEEIYESERLVWNGKHSPRPFVILVQPSLFDSRRAPPGHHSLWAYCHVPNGSTIDMTAAIEAQIERFAPGFRDLVLARNVMSPSLLEAHNANLIGGEIGGGESSLTQLFLRPVARRVPYATPLKGVYLCSASTPPGGAVHGMSGYHAATAALSNA